MLEATRMGIMMQLTKSMPRARRGRGIMGGAR
jgi:hypothetical protein